MVQAQKDSAQLAASQERDGVRMGIDIAKSRAQAAQSRAQAQQPRTKPTK
jgi:hypothetical protein